MDELEINAILYCIENFKEQLDKIIRQNKRLRKRPIVYRESQVEEVALGEYQLRKQKKK